MDAGMALRALSANSFLSRFLFLAEDCCLFMVVEEERVILDGDEPVVLDLEFGLDCCLELVFFFVLVLDLLRLREISESVTLFCFLASLRVRERLSDDPDNSSGRRLLLELRLDCVLELVISLLLDLDRPLSSSPSPPVFAFALPLLLCRRGGGGGGLLRLLCCRISFHRQRMTTRR